MLNENLTNLNTDLKEGVTIPTSALTWKFTHSGGPGGQGVNTSSSKVQLFCDSTKIVANEDDLKLIKDNLAAVLIIVSETERSQLENRLSAIEKLVAKVNKSLTPVKERISTKTPKFSKEARINDKKKIAKVKKLRKVNLKDQD